MDDWKLHRNWVVTWKDADARWHNDFYVPMESSYMDTLDIKKERNPRQAAMNYAKKLMDWGIDNVHFHEEGYD